MNLQFYIEKLNFSKEYFDFIKENPDSYFCSGFFMFDKESKNNQIHLDFYLPKKKEIISFKLENQIEKMNVESFKESIPEKMDFEIDFSFEEIEKIISDEIEKHNKKTQIQKIIFSLQKNKGEVFLVCTIFVNFFGLIKINIRLKDKKIILFEKKSLFDFVRKAK